MSSPFSPKPDALDRLAALRIFPVLVFCLFLACVAMVGLVETPR